MLGWQTGGLAEVLEWQCWFSSVLGVVVLI